MLQTPYHPPAGHVKTGRFPDSSKTPILGSQAMLNQQNTTQQDKSRKTHLADFLGAQLSTAPIPVYFLCGGGYLPLGSG